MSENVKTVRKLSNEEISVFCSSAAMILDSGMTLHEGLEVLSESGDNEAGDLCRAVGLLMNESGSLSEALRQYGRFPEYMTEMTAVGEKTGRLGEVLRGLQVYYAREGRIRGAIVSAITYPMILGFMVLGIIVVMFTAVMPVFGRVLSGMGIAMTSSGTTMMHIGTSAGAVVIAAVGLIVVLAVAMLVMYKCGRGRQVLELLCRVLPPVRSVNQILMGSRLFSVLGMMLSAGFTMDDALEMVPAVIGDETVNARVNRLRQQMGEGVPFADALKDSKLLDDLHVRMLSVAAAAGRESEEMLQLAQNYEEQAEEAISRLVSIIEPTLVALLCLVIGGILLSVMLPMAGIISSIL